MHHRCGASRRSYLLLSISRHMSAAYRRPSTCHRQESERQTTIDHQIGKCCWPLLDRDDFTFFMANFITKYFSIDPLGPLKAIRSTSYLWQFGCCAWWKEKHIEWSSNSRIDFMRPKNAGENVTTSRANRRIKLILLGIDLEKPIELLS